MGITLEHSLRLGVNIKKKLKEFSLDVEFEAGRGCLGILGSSGCGKSMTLKSVAGIVTPDKGRIALSYAQGEAAGGRVFYDSSLKINQRPQMRRIGYLFQNYALFPNMTVEQNILAGLQAMKGSARGSDRKSYLMSAGNQKNRVKDMVSRFRLEGLERRYPSQLSGGQQQRVALARILAYEPEVLLLDEPFSAMDSYLKEGLRLELSQAIKDYSGVTVMVTHDRDEAYQLCDTLLLLDKGKVLEGGPVREQFKRPLTCQAARLTGCKNISRIEPLGPYRVRALDWNGLELTTEERVEAYTTAVGIRAHHLEPLSEGEAAGWHGKEDGNLIEVVSPRISEMPFERCITLENGLWWKTEKGGAVPRWLRVEPSSVLLLRGEPD